MQTKRICCDWPSAVSPKPCQELSLSWPFSSESAVAPARRGPPWVREEESQRDPDPNMDSGIHSALGMPETDAEESLRSSTMFVHWQFDLVDV